MDWLVMTVAAFAAIVLGFRTGSKSSAPLMAQQARSQANDRMMLLNVLRREIGSILIWNDPDRFVSLYSILHAEISKYANWQPNARQSLFDEIAKKYPDYRDFDLLGTRTYILYPDASEWHSNEQLEEHYRNIARFQALLIASDKDWQFNRSTSDEELKHVSGYAQRVKDTQLKLRLKSAVHDYWIAQSGQAHSLAFENGSVRVQPIADIAESVLGVHLKDRNEFGIYTSFMHDDGHTSDGYYRSDATFEDRLYLNSIKPAVDSVAATIGL